VLTCIDLFVRSMSCVEVRNGRLVLWHHHLHRLSDKRLTALTVIHNYWIRRADGSTAPERFFEVPLVDLFEWLLDHHGPSGSTNCHARSCLGRVTHVDDPVTVAIVPSSDREAERRELANVIVLKEGSRALDTWFVETAVGTVTYLRREVLDWQVCGWLLASSGALGKSRSPVRDLKAGWARLPEEWRPKRYVQLAVIAHLDSARAFEHHLYGRRVACLWHRGVARIRRLLGQLGLRYNARHQGASK